MRYTLTLNLKLSAAPLPFSQDASAAVLATPPPPPLARICSGQLFEEFPSVLISSGLLVQANEGVSLPVMDLIDESTAAYREEPVFLILTQKLKRAGGILGFHWSRIIEQHCYFSILFKANLPPPKSRNRKRKSRGIHRHQYHAEQRRKAAAIGGIGLRYLTTDTSGCSQQISALPLNETSRNHQTLYSQKKIKNDAASTNQNDTASLQQLTTDSLQNNQQLVVLINSKRRPTLAPAHLLPADTSSNATTEKRNNDASLTRCSRNLKCATIDFTKRERITPTPPTADNRLHHLVQLLNSTGIRFISQNPQNSLD
ncbi:hypothetical protein F511_33460 [Dorcoceras hygrometricum]|uniref:Uncharacterized protein n=1 Tax=Dorcoceras hygrometricum TaxID=472368 RepID=A0A2Z7CF15_9LAMI|nr:hypothetical protein F511_33460 [Dorcoceras hygrometricum]